MNIFIPCDTNGRDEKMLVKIRITSFYIESRDLPKTSDLSKCKGIKGRFVHERNFTEQQAVLN